MVVLRLGCSLVAVLGAVETHRLGEFAPPPFWKRINVGYFEQFSVPWKAAEKLLPRDGIYCR